VQRCGDLYLYNFVSYCLEAAESTGTLLERGAIGSCPQEIAVKVQSMPVPATL